MQTFDLRRDSAARRVLSSRDWRRIDQRQLERLGYGRLRAWWTARARPLLRR